MNIKATEVKDMELYEKLPEHIKPYVKYICFYKTMYWFAMEAERDEHHIISNNPVSADNKKLMPLCATSASKPEEKAMQPDDIQKLRDNLWKRIETKPYTPNYYAILFAIETGVREGEIPSLKWTDIKDKSVHIHTQQLEQNINGHRVYYSVNYTKNERGIENGGRFFPMTAEIRRILESLKERQIKEGIKSEYVFAKKDGSWTTTRGYATSLRRIAEQLNLGLTNNHSLRMALNSYVFIPQGLEAPDRAKLLGHSPEVNQRNYTFAHSDDYMDEILKKLDRFQGGPQGTSEIIQFPEQRKSPERAKIKAFS